MGKLDNRVAIVTGGGRGIGRATCLRLASDGAAVVVNDIDGDPADETAEIITSTGGRAISVVANTVDLVEAERLTRLAAEEFGSLDILVNNAGTTRDKMFHGLTDEAFDLVMDANLRTVFHTTSAAMPYMRDEAKREIAETGLPAFQRKIVLTSSVAAMMGNPGQFNYTAAKGAIISVTKTLARELGKFGINVNAVAPGFIETRLTAAKKPGDKHGIPEEMRTMAKMIISLGRLGEPEEVANVTAFLCSPDSDFVSGITIPVTGGQLGGM